jgi:alpha-beta hydrolase superfamily lysophospholipase
MDKENVTVLSNGDKLVGVLFLPDSPAPSAALIICHGALLFKENCFELCEYLAKENIAALALDMHGHGASEGARFHVDMREWESDVHAALDFLEHHPRIDKLRLGAFGHSSGGTAILEAALTDKRLKALVTLDATVRNSLGFLETLAFRILIGVGILKKALTRQELRFSLLALSGGIPSASDVVVDQQIKTDPRFVEAASAFPLPGAIQFFFVDTLRRVDRIAAPTLVLWGEEDRVDSPETARLLYNALCCKKQLQILPGNGHMGHNDRNKNRVFELTASWVLENLTCPQNPDQSG